MTTDSLTADAPKTDAARRVILASSLGTVFEWYDFYLYGSLAVFFGGLFFPPGNETASFLASLATFGAGFAVRPFGALVFGRLGDLAGRKHTFLLTILIMGFSTIGVGLLPTYATAGMAAPVLLVFLRLLQGLALGGEYGGAATYVAEHAPDQHRGRDTSWIQTTATLGFFLSLAVILATRTALGEEAFKSWGWRVPFLVSALLLAVSVYIRFKLEESPVFLAMKSHGKGSKAPLRETFAEPANRRLLLLALFGAAASQGVVWYAGQFYALFFLQNVLKVDFRTAYILIATALLLGTPFFIVFGTLSDRIGRRSIMMTGCILSALTLIPIFKGLTHFANPKLEAAAAASPVILRGPRTGEGLVAREYLAKRGIPYVSQDGALVSAKIGSVELPGYDAAAYAATLAAAGYPEAADPALINKPMVVLLLFILLLYVAMVYGPIAAFLVELFPARIRYTSMSFPYHIGNGWFGGFLPLIASWVVVRTGDIYAGLWYPIGIAAMTAAVSALYLRETKQHKIAD
ncbi:MAG: MHS family MFS transporter [Elusimicrobiota bacterium]|nr:MAG: MHS family MFS transporter [Elusimicrobiota bacterium]